MGPMIIDGFVHQLPDTDPDETQEWRDSLEAVVEHPGQGPCPLPRVHAPRACPRAAGRHARHRVHPLRQHDPARGGAVLPRRRGHRAPHPRLHPVERGGDGGEGQQARRRHRRPPRHLRQLGRALRGGLQPLLPRQGRRPGRRPHLLPGPRRAGHLRPRLPRGAAHRGAARPLPPRGRRQGPVVVPAPAPDAGLLGVPHRVDGARAAVLDLPRPVQQVPPQPQDRGHERITRVVLHRRRRVRRARDARLDLAGRARGPRQPHVGRQLQPPAPRRTRARQRQDHPGARGGVPRRRLERDQGHLGRQVGRAAHARRRRRAAEPHERDASTASSSATPSSRAPTPASTSSAPTRGCEGWWSTSRTRRSATSPAAGTTTGSSTPPTRPPPSSRAAPP